MGNAFSWQCEASDNLSDGLKKCYFDRIISLTSFIIFWFLFYQIYFVYYLTYNVPVFQFGRLQKMRTRDYRMDILLICAISSFYTTIHYLAWHEYRSRLFALITIMKFNIMILISYYYLKMASEQIF